MHGYALFLDAPYMEYYPVLDSHHSVKSGWMASDEVTVCDNTSTQILPETSTGPFEDQKGHISE